MENYAFANTNYDGFFQGVVLPFQFENKKNWLDAIYIGGEYSYSKTIVPKNNPIMTTRGAVLGGCYLNASVFILTVGEEYWILTKQTYTNLGLIYKIK